MTGRNNEIVLIENKSNLREFIEEVRVKRKFMYYLSENFVI